MTATPLREHGVYTFWDGACQRNWVAVASDEGGYVLYSPDEWLDASTADYEIDADGRITARGEPWGVMADALTDTEFTAEGSVFRAVIDTRTVMGTDWPVIAEIARCEPGQTDQGEPVSWWVSQFFNTAYEGEGYGTATFSEAVTAAFA